MDKLPIHIVGAGLAGSEAALQLAFRKIPVRLFEMRPLKMTEAHKTGFASELVCSNTFKSVEVTNAHGLLKEELNRLGSFLMPVAEKNRIPAGSALAVDRNAFSQKVTEILDDNPFIERVNQEVTEIDTSRITLLATGPLTSKNLQEHLKEKLNLNEDLYFYDAISPIVSYESIDWDHAFMGNRYEEGDVPEGDYINCPLNKEEYELFIRELLNAEKVEAQNFEKAHYFEGCMPIEVMASRGKETLRFGPMKPVGLRDPKTGHRPWAVLQLRRENEHGSAWNLVGFQTKLKYGEQKRIFGLIPALRNVEFFRLGSMHRNTYFNSPNLLNPNFSFKKLPNLYLAGQITGVEGYTESTAMGLLAALSIYKRLIGQKFHLPPTTTALGALSDILFRPPEHKGGFQPMNVNFGLFPNLEIDSDFPKKKLPKKQRRALISKRALDDLIIWNKRYDGLSSHFIPVEDKSPPMEHLPPQN